MIGVEHRCATRMPVAFEATLRSRARSAARVTVRNLGIGGLFVEMEGGPPLCAVVELVVTLPGHPGERRCWPAMVVHRQTDGVGLMFDRSHADDVAELTRDTMDLSDSPPPGGWAEAGDAARTGVSAAA